MDDRHSYSPQPCEQQQPFFLSLPHFSESTNLTTLLALPAHTASSSPSPTRQAIFEPGHPPGTVFDFKTAYADDFSPTRAKRVREGEHVAVCKVCLIDTWGKESRWFALESGEYRQHMLLSHGLSLEYRSRLAPPSQLRYSTLAPSVVTVLLNDVYCPSCVGWILGAVAWDYAQPYSKKELKPKWRVWWEHVKVTLLPPKAQPSLPLLTVPPLPPRLPTMLRPLPPPPHLPLHAFLPSSSVSAFTTPASSSSSSPAPSPRCRPRPSQSKHGLRLAQSAAPLPSPSSTKSTGTAPKAGGKEKRYGLRSVQASASAPSLANGADRAIKLEEPARGLTERSSPVRRIKRGREGEEMKPREEDEPRRKRMRGLR
ncbi:hypothetical protein JCM8097_007313 [Rhodosporidiobolus ruineniae]